MSFHVLLTGATGALGPLLSAELLRGGAADTLTILTRPHPSGADRFGHLAELVAANAAAHPGAARMQNVCADMRLDHLGLSPVDEQRLKRQTQVIIHAAADTRFRGPPHEQWNTNVDGARRMLDLAAACPNLRKFIFVSTVCVSGTGTGLIREAFDPTPPAFVNYYEQTKWEAERLVLHSQLPVEIARVSIVSGSHATGAVHRVGALHHVLRWFGRGLIPHVPGTPESLVDLIASETAAKLIARTVISQPRPGAVYHFAAGRQAAPLDQLMEFTWEQMRGRFAAAHGEPPQIVDGQTFREFCRSLDPGRQRILAEAAQSIESFLPALLFPRTYDTTRAEELWGGPLPLYDWRQTLTRVFRAGNLKGRPALRRVRVG